MAESQSQVAGAGAAVRTEGVVENCKVVQALDMSRGMNLRVGHVLAVTVVGATLKSDLKLRDPMSGAVDKIVSAVGVIEKVLWAGGRRDPIELTCWISTKNWQLIAREEAKNDDGAEDDEELAECAFSFDVYDFDSVAKKTYKSFHTNGASVKGLFRFDGQDIVVGHEPHPDIRSPELFQLTLKAKPKSPQQDLQVGLASEATQTKPWGETAVIAALAAAKRAKERVSRRVEEKRKEEERAKRNAARTADEKAVAEAEKKAEADKTAEQARVAKLAERTAKLTTDRDRLLEEAKALEAKAKAAEESANAEEAARVAGESEVAAERLRVAEEARLADEFAKREKALEEKFGNLRAALQEAFEKAQAAARKKFEADETRSFEQSVRFEDALSKLVAPKDEREIADLRAKIVQASRDRPAAQSAFARGEEERSKARTARETALREEEAEERKALRQEESERMRSFESARDAARALKERLEAQAERERKDRKEAERRAQEKKHAWRRVLTDLEAARATSEGAKNLFEPLTKAMRAELDAERAQREAQQVAELIAQRANRIAQLEKDLEQARALTDALTQSRRRRHFRQDMSIGLKLTLGSESKEVPGGSVASFHLDMNTWGYRGEIEFLVTLDKDEDTLITGFSGTKLIEVELTLQSKFQPEKSPPDPLKVVGIVLERHIVEDSFDALSEEKILRRRYRFTFSDPAYAIWKQHYPCELLTEKTLMEVIESHLAGKVTITGDWPGHLDNATRHIFLALRDAPGAASFYDFLIWYCDRNFGVFTYDAAKNAYAIVAAKPDPGTALKVDADDVDRVQVFFPAVPRCAARVMNGWSEATTKTKDIAFDDAVLGVRRDRLLRTAIPSEFESAGTLETARMVSRKPEARLLFARFPTITFAPGLGIDFSADSWSKDLFTKGKSYRVRSYSIRARASSSPDGTSEKSRFGEFLLEVNAALEEKGDTVPHLPPYTAPSYPAFIEAKIVSSGGTNEDRTWFVADDKKTSISYYKVDVPLWNKKIPALFIPNLYSGHFFFPAYKNERVLLALDLHTAEIARFLDWAPLGRLPLDTQGNHILMGKREKDETSISHTYVDAKPVVTIVRNKAGDTQTVTISEGVLSIEVKADDAAVAPPPQFDVTMQIEQSKGEMSMQVGGSISEFSGKFAAAIAGPTAAISATQSEVSGALAEMDSEISGKIGEVRGELEGKLGGLEGGAGKLDAAASEAIAALEGLIT